MPGIKLKPKTSMSSDATRVDRGMTPKQIGDGIKVRLSKMTDKQLEDEAATNLIDLNEPLGVSKQASAASLELAKRKVKYSKGTKGIKVKSKAS